MEAGFWAGKHPMGSSHCLQDSAFMKWKCELIEMEIDCPNAAVPKVSARFEMQESAGQLPVVVQTLGDGPICLKGSLDLALYASLTWHSCCLLELWGLISFAAC